MASFSGLQGWPKPRMLLLGVHFAVLQPCDQSDADSRKPLFLFRCNAQLSKSNGSKACCANMAICIIHSQKHHGEVGPLTTLFLYLHSPLVKSGKNQWSNFVETGFMLQTTNLFIPVSVPVLYSIIKLLILTVPL